MMYLVFFSPGCVGSNLTQLIVPADQKKLQKIGGWCLYLLYPWNKISQKVYSNISVIFGNWVPCLVGKKNRGLSPDRDARTGLEPGKAWNPAKLQT